MIYFWLHRKCREKNSQRRGGDGHHPHPNIPLLLHCSEHEHEHEHEHKPILFPIFRYGVLDSSCIDLCQSPVGSLQSRGLQCSLIVCPLDRIQGKSASSFILFSTEILGFICP